MQFEIKTTIDLPITEEKQAVIFRRNLTHTPNETIKNRNGIYLFFNHQDDLLYIGYSSSMQEALKEHIKGRKEHTKEFAHEIGTIRIIANEDYENISEDLTNLGYDTQNLTRTLISLLEPKYNKVRVNPSVIRK